MGDSQDPDGGRPGGKRGRVEEEEAGDEKAQGDGDEEAAPLPAKKQSTTLAGVLMLVQHGTF